MPLSRRSPRRKLSMSNLGYIVAAYVITLGTLALYGLHLWSRLRAVEQELTALTAGERAPYGRH